VESAASVANETPAERGEILLRPLGIAGERNRFGALDG